jgi:hypothetical protein
MCFGLWQNRRNTGVEKNDPSEGPVFALAMLLSAFLMTIIVSGTDLLESHFGDFGWIAIGIYGAVFILAVTDAFEYTRRQFLKTWQFRGLDIVTLILAVGSLQFLIGFAFGDLSRELYIQFGGFSGVTSTSPFWHYTYTEHSVFQHAVSPWVYFTSYWISGGLTFDTYPLFGWITTAITPTAWWSELLTVILNGVTGLLLFTGIINLYRVIWRS